MQRVEQRYVRDILGARPGYMPVDRLLYGGRWRHFGNWTDAAARALGVRLNDGARQSTQENG